MGNSVMKNEHILTKENNSQGSNIVDTITNIESESLSNSHQNIIDNKSFNLSSTNDIPIEENQQTSFSLRKYWLLICISIAILLFLCIFSTIFALINSKSNKIINGVSVNGVDISGLNSAEAIEKLSIEFSKKLDTTLTLTYQDYTTELIPSKDIDAKYDIFSAVQIAYSFGRSGNIIQKNYEILISSISSKKVSLGLQYDIEKLNSYIKNVSTEIPGTVVQPSYYIEDAELIIVRGISGIQLLESETQNLIISNIETLSSSNLINLPVQNVEPNEIDIDNVYKEIYSEPQNAYIIREPFELNVGSSGIDFAISLEEAKNLLQDNKSEYIIPLKITPPKIGVENLGNDIFVHTLGTYSSKFNVYNYNRSTNVNLATKKINNVILLPGETFSYNKTVGERTIANGFKEASVYTSSGVINGLGGGICQVSSTLYNAVLESNLEIIERKNHSYAVSYVPLGRDATVSYGSIDFKFKNSRKYPIKIIAYTKNGTLSISIKGIKEDVEYDVLITTKKIETTPYKTTYIEDSSLAVGTQKETQYGDYGYKYETYKTLKLNGSVISSELISNDTYKPLNRVVKVGTKKSQIVSEPTPTSTPVPTPTPTPIPTLTPSPAQTLIP